MTLKLLKLSFSMYISIFVVTLLTVKGNEMSSRLKSMQVSCIHFFSQK